jgi:hypothetical protein
MIWLLAAGHWELNTDHGCCLHTVGGFRLEVGGKRAIAKKKNDPTIFCLKPKAKRSSEQRKGVKSSRVVA